MSSMTTELFSPTAVEPVLEPRTVLMPCGCHVSEQAIMSAAAKISVTRRKNNNGGRPRKVAPPKLNTEPVTSKVYAVDPWLNYPY